MNNDTKMSSGDTTRFDDANADTIWDPRADMDDDGDVDANDETLYDAKYSDWSGAGPSVDPRQAFSDKGNPFMFQGIPHFALDTATSATEGKLMLNHHRARFADPVTGRWISRDPLYYNAHARARTTHRTLHLVPSTIPSISIVNAKSEIKHYASKRATFDDYLANYQLLASNPSSHLDPNGESIISEILDTLGYVLSDSNISCVNDGPTSAGEGTDCAHTTSGIICNVTFDTLPDQVWISIQTANCPTQRRCCPEGADCGLGYHPGACLPGPITATASSGPNANGGTTYSVDVYQTCVCKYCNYDI
jgi:hypothetical protein